MQMEGKALTEPRDAVDRSLYNRMSVVTHVVIVLYSTAFWIQTGALPVSAYGSKDLSQLKRLFCCIGFELFSSFLRS